MLMQQAEAERLRQKEIKEAAENLRLQEEISKLKAQMDSKDNEFQMDLKSHERTAIEADVSQNSAQRVAQNRNAATLISSGSICENNQSEQLFSTDKKRIDESGAVLRRCASCLEFKPENISFSRSQIAKRKEAASCRTCTSAKEPNVRNC